MRSVRRGRGKCTYAPHPAVKIKADPFRVKMHMHTCSCTCSCACTYTCTCSCACPYTCTCANEAAHIYLHRVMLAANGIIDNAGNMTISGRHCPYRACIGVCSDMHVPVLRGYISSRSRQMMEIEGESDRYESTVHAYTKQAICCWRAFRAGACR